MKCRIFILDDKKENLAAAVAALSEYAEEIRTATSYEEGAEIIECFTPDMAFIDMNFPRSANGAEEKLGEEFRKEFLQPMNITNTIVTGGKDHGEDVVIIKPAIYFPFGKINPEQKGWYPNKSVLSAKTHAHTWETAWNHTFESIEEHLKKLGGLEFYVTAIRKLRSEM
ncbi:MAG TPA: response regulator [Patescibacteria group bacterium]